MGPLVIQLAGVIVHLAEYIETGCPLDLEAAQGLLATSSRVADLLEPGPLIPVTRSDLSVAEIITIKIGKEAATGDL